MYTGSAQQRDVAAADNLHSTAEDSRGAATALVFPSIKRPPHGEVGTINGRPYTSPSLHPRGGGRRGLLLGGGSDAADEDGAGRPPPLVARTQSGRDLNSLWSPFTNDTISLAYGVAAANLYAAAHKDDEDKDAATRLRAQRAAARPRLTMGSDDDAPPHEPLTDPSLLVNRTTVSTANSANRVSEGRVFGHFSSAAPSPTVPPGGVLGGRRGQQQQQHMVRAGAPHSPGHGARRGKGEELSALSVAALSPSPPPPPPRRDSIVEMLMEPSSPTRGRGISGSISDHRTVVLVGDADRGAVVTAPAPMHTAQPPQEARGGEGEGHPAASLPRASGRRHHHTNAVLRSGTLRQQQTDEEEEERAKRELLALAVSEGSSNDQWQARTVAVGVLLGSRDGVVDAAGSAERSSQFAIATAEEQRPNGRAVMALTEEVITVEKSSPSVQDGVCWSPPNNDLQRSQQPPHPHPPKALLAAVSRYTANMRRSGYPSSPQQQQALSVAGGPPLVLPPPPPPLTPPPISSSPTTTLVLHAKANALTISGDVTREAFAEIMSWEASPSPSSPSSSPPPSAEDEVPQCLLLPQIREHLLRQSLLDTEGREWSDLARHERARRSIIGGIGPMNRFLLRFVVWPFRARRVLRAKQRGRVDRLELTSRADILSEEQREWNGHIVGTFVPEEEALFRQQFYRTALLSLYAFARIQLGGLLALAYDELYFMPMEECALRWGALFPRCAPDWVDAEGEGEGEEGAGGGTGGQRLLTQGGRKRRGGSRRRSSAVSGGAVGNVDEDASSSNATLTEEEAGYYVYSEENAQWYWFQNGAYFEVEGDPNAPPPAGSRRPSISNGGAAGGDPSVEGGGRHSSSSSNDAFEDGVDSNATMSDFAGTRAYVQPRLLGSGGGDGDDADSHSVGRGEVSIHDSSQLEQHHSLLPTGPAAPAGPLVGPDGSSSDGGGAAVVDGRSSSFRLLECIHPSDRPEDPNDPLVIALKRQQQQQQQQLLLLPSNSRELHHYNNGNARDLVLHHHQQQQQHTPRFQLVPTAIANTSYCMWELDAREWIGRRAIEAAWLKGWRCGRAWSELTTVCLWKERAIRHGIVEEEEDFDRRLFWIKYRRATAIKQLIERAFEESHRRNLIIQEELEARGGGMHGDGDGDDADANEAHPIGGNDGNGDRVPNLYAHGATSYPLAMGTAAATAAGRRQTSAAASNAAIASASQPQSHHTHSRQQHFSFKQSSVNALYPFFGRNVYAASPPPPADGHGGGALSSQTLWQYYRRSYAAAMAAEAERVRLAAAAASAALLAKEEEEGEDANAATLRPVWSLSMLRVGEAMDVIGAAVAAALWAAGTLAEVDEEVSEADSSHADAVAAVAAPITDTTNNASSTPHALLRTTSSSSSSSSSSAWPPSSSQSLAAQQQEAPGSHTSIDAVVAHESATKSVGGAPSPSSVLAETSVAEERAPSSPSLRVSPEEEARRVVDGTEEEEDALILAVVAPPLPRPCPSSQTSGDDPLQPPTDTVVTSDAAMTSGVPAADEGAAGEVEEAATADGGLEIGVSTAPIPTAAGNNDAVNYREMFPSSSTSFSLSFGLSLGAIESSEGARVKVHAAGGGGGGDHNAPPPPQPLHSTAGGGTGVEDGGGISAPPPMPRLATANYPMTTASALAVADHHGLAAAAAHVDVAEAHSAAGLGRGDDDSLSLGLGGLGLSDMFGDSMSMSVAASPQRGSSGGAAAPPAASAAAVTADSPLVVGSHQRPPPPVRDSDANTSSEASLAFPISTSMSMSLGLDLDVGGVGGGSIGSAGVVPRRAVGRTNTATFGSGAESDADDVTAAPLPPSGRDAVERTPHMGGDGTAASDVSIGGDSGGDLGDGGASLFVDSLSLSLE